MNEVTHEQRKAIWKEFQVLVPHTTSVMGWNITLMLNEIVRMRAELEARKRHDKAMGREVRIEQSSAPGSYKAARGNAPLPCVWRETMNGEYWSSDCGKEYSDEDGQTPLEAGMKFCPWCGKPIAEARYIDDADDDIYAGDEEPPFPDVEPGVTESSLKQFASEQAAITDDEIIEYLQDGRIPIDPRITPEMVQAAIKRTEGRLIHALSVNPDEPLADISGQSGKV